MKSKIVLLLLILFLISCGRQYTPEQQKYIASIEEQRKQKDESMKNDEDSPFNQEPKQHFEPLKYYDVDPDFVFKSKLIEYGTKDTISVYGTKGEERKVVRFGYVSISFQNKNYKMNVYNGTSRSGENYYSIWFTDKTTGEETYGVGRYLDFELNADIDFLYTIDFNRAYSPYCSYSPKYSCAVPTKDDYLDIEVKAGEKKFHN